MEGEDRHSYKRLHKTHVLPLYARLVHTYTACVIMFIAHAAVLYVVLYNGEIWCSTTLRCVRKAKGCIL